MKNTNFVGYKFFLSKLLYSEYQINHIKVLSIEKNIFLNVFPSVSFADQNL